MTENAYNVYLIEEIPLSGEIGHWTKIGYSRNPPEWRMNANLKRGNPRTIRVAAVYRFPTEAAAREMEKNAHAVFKDAAHEKEWFSVNWQKIDEWFAKQGIIRLANV